MGTAVTALAPVLTTPAALHSDRRAHTLEMEFLQGKPGKYFLRSGNIGAGREGVRKTGHHIVQPRRGF
jgi:hypothetical protein